MHEETSPLSYFVHIETFSNPSFESISSLSPQMPPSSPLLSLSLLGEIPFCVFVFSQQLSGASVRWLFSLQVTTQWAFSTSRVQKSHIAWHSFSTFIPRRGWYLYSLSFSSSISEGNSCKKYDFHPRNLRSTLCKTFQPHKGLLLHWGWISHFFTV